MNSLTQIASGAAAVFFHAVAVRMEALAEHAAHLALVDSDSHAVARTAASSPTVMPCALPRRQPRGCTSQL